ncbi:MAG: hypothetical protein LBD75_02325 [Candidatus Peribacteria bacterium]|jgi:hypothetical protein|nr:hypothetical protein [Candidatus Peribacteria bacterium]
MADLTTTTLTSKETSCEGGIRDYVYYLGTSHPMKDTFFEGDGASASEYIYVFNFDLSEAAIWNSGVFSNNYSWQRKSQGLPKGVKKVVAVSSDNGVTIINKPANYTSRNTVAAQVVFKINSRKYEWKKAGNENTIQYIDFDHQADGWKNYNYGPPKLISDKQVKNECLNIHI